MTSLAEEKLNFIKLNYVLTPHATEVLREIFRKKWFKATKRMWTYEQTEEFLQGKGKEIFVSASRRQKMLLGIGALELWDFNLLITILLKFDFGAANPTKREKKLINRLGEIHADFRKDKGNSISNKDFNTAWDAAESILTKLGDSSEKSKPKKTDQLRATNINATSIPDSIASTFRKVGNEFFIEGNMTKAIKSYVQGINLRPCKSEWAILFSNLAAARLKLRSDSFELHAKEDLKNSIELIPTWSKSHYRLGCVYQQIGNHVKARKQLEIALVLEPDNDQIKKKLDEVKVAEEKEDSDDESIDDESFLACEMINVMRGGSDLVMWRAKCYLRGWKVEKDEELAAKLLLQVVDNDVALINLSFMYAEGMGVERDKKKGFQYLMKIVNRSSRPTSELAMAECLLGWYYRRGIGVIKDLQLSVMWYKKACDHGCAESATALRYLYLKGSGVEKDVLKAMYYENVATVGIFQEMFSGLPFPFAAHLF